MIVICASLLLPVSQECAFRIAGFSLQFLGIATVAIGLNDSRRFFGRPWLKRPPSFYGDVHHLQVQSVVQHNESSTGKIEVLRKYSREAFEERISYLETALRNVEAQIVELRQSQKTEFRILTEAIENEKTDRCAEDERIGMKLEKAVIGGIMLEAIGVIWLVFGAALSSFPKELAQALGTSAGV